MILTEFKSYLKIDPISRFEKKKVTVKKAIDLLSLKSFLKNYCKNQLIIY